LRGRRRRLRPGRAGRRPATRAGHDVVVYERADRIGGLLRYGIPAFKMEKRRLDQRLEQLRAEGTTFRLGVDVGGDLTASQLRASTDAILLACGAVEHRELPVPGRALSGVHPAMEYLTWAGRLPRWSS
jgi:glutamate synthase (NADPH/NADH) small chain